MDAKNVIVIFLLGLLVGFGTGALIASVKSSEYEAKIIVLKRDIEKEKIVSDSLTAEAEALQKEITGQDGVISRQLLDIEKQKQKHEKNISSIRNLPADEQMLYLSGWLPQDGGN